MMSFPLNAGRCESALSAVAHVVVKWFLSPASLEVMSQTKSEPRACR
jgi:hypothetical protein